MTSALVLQCAQQLGLSLGIDGGPGPALALNEEDRRGLPKLFNKYHTCSRLEKDAFAAEFTASYLPSLIRTLTENPLPLRPRPSNESETSWRGLISMCFIAVQDDPSFSRWLREDLQRAINLYLTFASILSTIPTWMFYAIQDNGEGWGMFIFNLLVVFHTLPRCINQAFPSVTKLPTLDESIAVGLRSVLPHLRVGLTAPKDNPISQLPLAQWCSEVESLSEGLNLRFSSTKKFFESACWWSCELKRNGRVGLCVELEKGEEMMACGRCRCVRYCSKEHQKLDWKRHKKVCFEPSW